MRARTIVILTTVPREEFPEGVIPLGTVLDDPNAYKLVRRGCAEAVDEECEKATGMTPEALAAERANYPKMTAGIIPEDSEAWDRGWMRGYKPDGSWIPGPNAHECDYERARQAGLILPGDEEFE